MYSVAADRCSHLKVISKQIPPDGTDARTCVFIFPQKLHSLDLMRTSVFRAGIFVGNSASGSSPGNVHIFFCNRFAFCCHSRVHTYSRPFHLRPYYSLLFIHLLPLSSIQRASRSTSQVSRTRFPTMVQKNIGAAEESRGLIAFFFSKALVKTANKDPLVRPLQLEEFSSPDFHEVRKSS